MQTVLYICNVEKREVFSENISSCRIGFRVVMSYLGEHGKD